MQEANTERWCESRDTGGEEMIKIRREISELDNQNEKKSCFLKKFQAPIIKKKKRKRKFKNVQYKGIGDYS